MKRSEAARYAQWSAVVAFVLAGITFGIYLQRQWVAHVEKKSAPPSLPEDKERQSIGLTFSKVEGNRTIFTVQASKSTDFKGQNVSLLEDVKVTVFGKLGDRNDVIHTHSCNYSKGDGAIQCSGEVLMELQSAAAAERARQESSSAPSVVRVETSGVTFERATGRAQTVAPVKFSFPGGGGEGLGAVYFSEEGVLRLVKDARLNLQTTAPVAGAKAQGAPAREVAVRGSSLEFGKDSRTVVMQGPVTATTEAQQLTSGELVLILDAQNRAQRLVATPGEQGELPEVTSQSAQGKNSLKAEKLTCDLTPERWIQSIEAEGNVQGSSPTGTLRAERGDLEMWPRVNQAKLLTLRGNVLLQTQDANAGTSRNLKTNVLQMAFQGGQEGQASRLQRAETLEHGTSEWLDAAGAHSKLEADKLAMDYDASGKAQLMTATGSVQTERELKGRPTQTASASRGTVKLEPTGEWSQMNLQGSVHLKDADRTGEAQQGEFVKAAQTAILTGQAVVRDASSETRAPKITFWQATGDVEAEGGVRSTEFSGQTGTMRLSNSLPANITADHLQGNSKTGRALYTGHARLWQGPSVLEADSIELLREARVMNAVGKVRGVFQQETTAPTASGPAAKKQPALWHVSSGSLTYWDTESRAHLEKNVVVQSEDQRMRGPLLDLFFTHGEGDVGTSQISRAVGTGGVIVEQGDRRGTAEKGVYTAADQKFVLSGGNPTLFDPEQGTTSGRELTFFLADDTIVVDTGNGSRTLTKHPVQR
ncbi:MAG TPA: LptA/OstA family protein [Candidatus Acidoferrum sp.]|nr:LptA/OstA family protein [Candidatus Acidoferrum sp.]